MEIKRFAEGCGCLAGSTPKPPSPQALRGLLLGPLHAKGDVGHSLGGGEEGLWGDDPSSHCSVPGIPGKWPQLIFIFTFPFSLLGNLQREKGGGGEGREAAGAPPQLSILGLLCPIHHPYVAQHTRGAPGLVGAWGDSWDTPKRNPKICKVTSTLGCDGCHQDVGYPIAGIRLWVRSTEAVPVGPQISAVPIGSPNRL